MDTQQHSAWVLPLLACLACVCLASGADVATFAGPQARLRAQAMAADSAWLQAYLLSAWKAQHPQGDGGPDQQAVLGLIPDIADSWCGRPLWRPEGWLRAESLRLAQATREPLALYAAYHWSPFDVARNEPNNSFRRSQDSAAQQGQQRYPWFMYADAQAWCASTWSTVTDSDRITRADDIAKTLANIWQNGLVPDMAGHERIIWRIIDWYTPGYIDAIENPLGTKPLSTALLNIASQRGEEDWLACMLRGKKAYHAALLLIQPMDVMNDPALPANQRFQEASSHFQHAARLNPGASEPLCMQSRFALRTSRSPRDWLEASIAVEFDALEAYEKHLSRLCMPNQQGFFTRTIVFGRECLATGRFDTQVPQMFKEAVRAIVSLRYPESVGLADPYVQYVAHPDVRRDMERWCAAEVENHPQHPLWVGQVRSELACYLWVIGDHQAARAVLRAIPPEQQAPWVASAWQVTWAGLAQGVPDGGGEPAKQDDF